MDVRAVIVFCNLGLISSKTDSVVFSFLSWHPYEKIGGRKISKTDMDTNRPGVVFGIYLLI